MLLLSILLNMDSVSYTTCTPYNPHICYCPFCFIMMHFIFRREGASFLLSICFIMMHFIFRGGGILTLWVTGEQIFTFTYTVTDYGAMMLLHCSDWTLIICKCPTFTISTKLCSVTRLILIIRTFCSWGRSLLNVNKPFFSKLQLSSVISNFSRSSTGSQKCISSSNGNYAQ